MAKQPKYTPPKSSPPPLEIEAGDPLADELVDVGAQLEAVRRDVVAATSRLEAAHRDLDIAQTEITTLRAQIAQADSYQATLQGQVTGLQVQLEEARVSAAPVVLKPTTVEVELRAEVESLKAQLRRHHGFKAK
jgi:chromosome segregation ATPase